MTNDSIVIVGFARTPIGNLLGELKDFSGPELGSEVIKSAVDRAGLKPNDISEVIMGCVLPAGQGQAPARQAALGAGLPNTIPCTTINKVCGSGMKAVMLASDLLKTHSANIMVAGGMESMTNAPYLLQKARQGYRMGQREIYDHMILDGLEDVYDKKSMGYYAEQCVSKYGFNRQQQDEYAITSFKLAEKATLNGSFNDEIIPLTIETKMGKQTIQKDEHPFSVNPDKIPNLKAAFSKEGTVTAGNSSSIADGAAALVLMRAEDAKNHKIKAIATIVDHISSAKAPSDFTTAPIDATRALLKKLNWQVDEVDLFEINEAFAVVALAFMHDLNIPRDKVNVHGGACALGHPIGATGARILISLISALKEKNLHRGIATLCIGGGEATAVAIEMI